MVATTECTAPEFEPHTRATLATPDEYLTEIMIPVS